MTDNPNLTSLKEAYEKLTNTFQNLAPKIPTLNIPKIKLPKLKNIKSPIVIQEQNNWERHAELIGIQDSILKIQGKILEEQKSTSKMTLIIIILTILSLISTILTLILK
jgi:hypothetical protein